MAGLEAHIRDLCAQLLEPWTGGTDFDFVVDFGATLPSMVICELLGVPSSDREWVKEQIDTTFHIEPEVGMINDVSLLRASSSTAICAAARGEAEQSRR